MDSHSKEAPLRQSELHSRATEGRISVSYRRWDSSRCDESGMNGRSATIPTIYVFGSVIIPTTLQERHKKVRCPRNRVGPHSTPRNFVHDATV